MLDPNDILRENKQMELPIYKEHDLSKKSTKEIELFLTRLSLGSSPIIVYIDKLEEEKQLEILDSLSLIIEKDEINVNLPYPFFIVSNVNESFPFLNIVSNKENIPSFFFQQEKKPHVKETALLDRLALKDNRLKSIDIKTSMKAIQNFAQSHKRLRVACFEGEFLEELKKKLSKRS